MLIRFVLLFCKPGFKIAFTPEYVTYRSTYFLPVV
jgi:hypothetical protein